MAWDAPVQDEAELLDRVLPVVRQTVQTYLRTHSWADRDDVESDGLLAALQAVRTFEEDRGVPLGAWVTFRVRMGLVDGMRERLGRSLDDPEAEAERRAVLQPAARWHQSPAGENRPTLAEMTPATTASRFSETDLVEIREDLRQAIAAAGLNRDQAGALVDYFDRDRSLAQIGRAAGITESAAHHRLRRALVAIAAAHGEPDARPRLTDPRVNNARADEGTKR